MKSTIITVLMIMLLSPLEASEESDNSNTNESSEELRRSAGKAKGLKPLSNKNIRQFFDYFQDESKPESLSKLGKENIQRSMNPDVETEDSNIEKPLVPKSKPKMAAKEDVFVKVLNYKKVLNVNK